MALSPSLLGEVLQTLGAVLEQRGRAFEIVTVGGTSLLSGLGRQPTRNFGAVALVEVW